MRFFQEVGQIKLQNRRPVLFVFLAHFDFSVTLVCVERIAINYIQRRIYCPIMEMFML